MLQALQAKEAELPKSIDEQIEILLDEINRKQEQLEQDYNKVVHVKDYDLSEDIPFIYDNMHFVEARKRIIGRLRKREE